MWFLRKLALVNIVFPLIAVGFEPGNLGADSLIAFYETEASFEIPGHDSLNEVEPGLPEKLLNECISLEDNPHIRTSGLVSDEAKIGEYTYAEVCGAGGLGDYYFEAFSGLEMNKFDVLGSYYENGYFGNVSPLNTRNREGHFGIMYSDVAGAVLGMNASYLAKRDKPSVPSLRYGKTDIDSGGVDLEYDLNVWDNAKLSSHFGSTYSVYQTDSSRFRDYYLSAELGFAAFLWADNLSRVKLAVAQNTLNLREERNLEILYGNLSLNNDIPLTDWMNLGLGFSRYMYKSDDLVSRDYAFGALHFQIGRRTGIFIQYNPKLSIPVFRELYCDNPFTRISETPLFYDTYFSLEVGITERLLQNLSAGLTAYQTRFRSYPEMYDYNGDLGLEYGDAGRVHVNGGSVEYTVDILGFVSNSGFYSIEDATVETTGEFPSYVPFDRAGIDLRFYYKDRFSVKAAVKRLGKRLYRPDGYLPTAFTLGAKGNVKLIDGLEVYIQSENITDEQYELIRGILAPGRTISLGARLIL